MLKRLVGVAARALGATSEADLQDNIDRRMREHVERPPQWKRNLQDEAEPGEKSYLARHGRPRPE